MTHNPASESELFLSLEEIEAIDKMPSPPKRVLLATDGATEHGVEIVEIAEIDEVDEIDEESK